MYVQLLPNMFSFTLTSASIRDIKHLLRIQFNVKLHYTYSHNPIYGQFEAMYSGLIFVVYSTTYFRNQNGGSSK